MFVNFYFFIHRVLKYYKEPNWVRARFILLTLLPWWEIAANQIQYRRGMRDEY